MDYRKDFMNMMDQTLRQIKRTVSKTVLKVPEIEQKVLDATCNEPWGPHGSVLAEIAHASRNHDDYLVITACLWKRLASRGRNWRHVYKALTVLEYLIAHGSERILIDVWEHMDELEALNTEFEYIEPPPPCEKDHGASVRRKAEMLIKLLHDKNKVADLRAKAAVNCHKYNGIASSSFTSHCTQHAKGLGAYTDEVTMPGALCNNENDAKEEREERAPPTYDEVMGLDQNSMLSTIMRFKNRRMSLPASFGVLRGHPPKGRDKYGRSISLPLFTSTGYDAPTRTLDT
ncbi:hypothetical protein KP509_36G024400 [Ceratopteris richardii]|uniref:ENTH domain-containing protein n=1 Tax=Ceratopteris richardii TaxID=49495 RepID=A0A8T2QA73_CERRI|nr:hypothetical protein KP509_36G024400 [Ceratopteris richardii]